MKKEKIVLLSFAIILFIGGLIGYLKAHSIPSLIASSLFSLAFIGCAFALSSSRFIASLVAFGLALSLLAFFAYRFSLAYHFMPAGFMSILSAAMVIYLAAQIKRNS